MHQCARFCEDPKEEHGQALKWLGRYLHGTADEGITLKPSDGQLDLYVDSDFAGNWDPEIAGTDPSTARSRTGFILFYAGCPLVWTSTLQTEICLSSTEAEYVALSQALRTTIPIMNVLKEMKDYGYDIKATVPTVHCQVFEDNTGAIEIATVHKHRPRTKHINQKFHFFRSYIDSGDITIHKIDTAFNPADMLTKSVPFKTLQQHRRFIQKWDVGFERECEKNEVSPGCGSHPTATKFQESPAPTTPPT